MKNKVITEIYKKPKWYWFLPLVGFISYMSFVMKRKSEFEKDKEFKKLKVMEKKLFMYLNIFSILLFVVNIFVTNIGFFIWKKMIKRAGWII